MGPLGIPELIFIFVLALLIFGPKKLPELGRTFGKSMAEFRRASNDLRNTFQREMDTIDRENQDLKDVAQEVKQDLNAAYNEDSPDDSYSNSDSDPVTETSGASSDLSSSETAPTQEREAKATDSPPKAANGNEVPSGSASSDALKSSEVPDPKPGS